MALAISFHDRLAQDDCASLRDEVLAGFAAEPKRLAPKFFYDRRGSELFEEITHLPEYYLTRTEEGILAANADEIADRLGPGVTLVELGSGASRKVRLLLEALRPARYLGIDISRDFLLSSTQRLADDYPWLSVHALHADFSRPLALPGALDGGRPVAFFPGSSIGNFTPAEARIFLRNLHRLLPRSGGLLIGVDQPKERSVLEAAYNDSAGVTAAFNLNLLERIRRELDTDLDPARFRHHAFYNEAESRIEMHLVSRRAQTLRLEGRRFMFREGESLHTENSCKYAPETFRELAASSGFRPAAHWTDPNRWFSVHYLTRE
ncbi:Histidine N-alpha-methyltransferase [compost metagenome]|uniref:Dimethylhistidine N-methyltransferase n=1 Tax=Pseudomonas jinjuensis TaxID=198616 RepID=A0A1H0ENU5_9PSED|nr:L-histidine N(alpha)-methyltransferase [Pseudomonas jinjuensis]SDN84028.1 dimethylhistidine N-methyltransferase [Pseudomonas jinjuensis]